jgi:hypothetical protein
MSTKQQRIRFQPRVSGAEGREAANAVFLAEATRFNLRWRCQECVYQRPSDGQCSVGWPNEALGAASGDAIDAFNAPIFCKAFEIMDV